MNLRQLIVGGSLAVGSLAGGASAPPAEAAPVVLVEVAPSGCHSSYSGQTASGYCTVVPSGAWYYEQAICVNKAGAAYAVWSARSYQAWVTRYANCAYPYWVSSAQVVRST